MDVNRLLPQDKHDTSTMPQLLRLTDAEIEPILFELMTWVQDLNWPIAAEICEVIGRHTGLAEPYVLKVLRGTDEVWKYNILSKLLCAWSDRRCGDELLKEIQRIAERPTAAEAKDEVDLAAAELLEFFHSEDRRE